MYLCWWGWGWGCGCTIGVGTDKVLCQKVTKCVTFSSLTFSSRNTLMLTESRGSLFPPYNFLEKEKFLYSSIFQKHLKPFLLEKWSAYLPNITGEYERGEDSYI